MESLHKKLRFPLRTSAENVTKCSVSCGFGLKFHADLVLFGLLIINGKIQNSSFVAVVFRTIPNVYDGAFF